MIKLYDGLMNVISQLSNRRSAVASNKFSSGKIGDDQLRMIYNSGIGAKIVRVKSGYALNDTIQFDTEADEEFYNNNLAYDALCATRYMIGFGRGIIVLFQNGDDLSKPFTPDETRTIRRRVFSGDMVMVGNYGMDFEDDRYYKPLEYSVRGITIHWSRVVDFIYHQPPEIDAPYYKFGGISEFELIYPQLVNDAIVERASGSIVEKNSTVFYRVKGFRQDLQMGKDKDVIKYFSALEDNRSIYGAGIVDLDDEVLSLAQALTNLSEVDNITLRRLAMVTGLPLAWLVGENVKGMNSTGDNERQIFQDTIETIQYDYMLQPIKRLMKLHGRGAIKFKDNQGESALNRVEYQTKVIANAKLLYDMGEDHIEYLTEHDVTTKDDFAEFFKEQEDEATTQIQ